MNPITNDELVSHVLGFTSPGRAAEIEAAAKEDASLAAKLLCMRRSVGLDEAAEPAAIPVPAAPRRRRWLPARQPWRTLAASLAILLMSVGVSWAGWHFLKPQPLLQDDFEDEWGDMLLWDTPRRTVREENGHVRLLDRGYLRTKLDFAAPVRVSFRWKWLDLGGDFKYRETLTVALRTSGTPLPESPYEAADGILIFFSATGGTVSVANAPRPIAITDFKSVVLPADKWHDITILDDGLRIQVFIRGPAIPEEQAKNPIMEVVIPDQGPHHRIAFYNRERLASVSFESWLDDIAIWPLGR